jgi:hypothetical protein
VATSTCPHCGTPTPAAVVAGPEGAAFSCAGCKQQLLWRQGIAAPPTAVVPGRDSATLPEMAAARPPPLPPRQDEEIRTDLVVAPVPRRPTPPGGMALGSSGEIPIAKEHHAFVSAELVAVADPPAVIAPPKRRTPIVPLATLALGLGLGWLLFGRAPSPAPETALAPAPAEVKVVEGPPTPTPSAAPSPALAAALVPREEPPPPKKSPPRRELQVARPPRPGPRRPGAERTLNNKTVVLEYDDGTSEPVEVALEFRGPIENARARYQAGNKKLFAKDSAGAIADYIAAVDAYGGYAAAYRGLGLALADQGENAKAVTAFRTYLRSAPNARDAALIKKVVGKLETATLAPAPGLE